MSKAVSKAYEFFTNLVSGGNPPPPDESEHNKPQQTVEEDIKAKYVEALLKQGVDKELAETIAGNLKYEIENYVIEQQLEDKNYQPDPEEIEQLVKDLLSEGNLGLEQGSYAGEEAQMAIAGRAAIVCATNPLCLTVLITGSIGYAIWWVNNKPQQNNNDNTDSDETDKSLESKQDSDFIYKKKHTEAKKQPAKHSGTEATTGGPGDGEDPHEEFRKKLAEQYKKTVGYKIMKANGLIRIIWS